MAPWPDCSQFRDADLYYTGEWGEGLPYSDDDDVA